MVDLGEIKKAIKVVKRSMKVKHPTQAQRWKVNDAFEKLWAYAGKPASRLQTKYFCSGMDAADFKQLCYVGAFKACEYYNGVGNIKAYFYRAMRNHVFTALHYELHPKRNGGKQILSLDSPPPDGNYEEVSLAAIIADDTQDDTDRLPMREMLLNLLAKLKEELSDLEHQLLAAYFRTLQRGRIGQQTQSDRYSIYVGIQQELAAVGKELQIKQIDNALGRLRKKAQQLPLLDEYFPEDKGKRCRRGML